MNLTLDLSEQNAAALEAQARAADVPTDVYLNRIIERALHNGESEVTKPRKSAYGLLAKYGPGPTDEEIEENRREMFGRFGELEL